MMKRGRYNRPFLHLAAMGVLAVGVVFSPFLASTYPIFSEDVTQASKIESNKQQSILVGDDLFKTDVSAKPRDKIISYKVQKGDTLSTISKKFGISVDTIKWQNDLTGDNLSVGDELEILPVSGVSHKVASGETVYTIAKKFDTNPQKIVDFPFNDFANPETFSLVSGQVLIVPDGVPPPVQPTYVKPKPQFIAQGPTAVSSAGFAWPLHGGISQFASWYHMAIDITADIGTPIVAANSGRVSTVSTGTYDGGYGNNVYVDSGNGIVTHYAHMSSVAVSSGQSVIAGSTIIGYVGMTGRTTGPHLHFELLKNGVLQNPLSYLQ